MRTHFGIHRSGMDKKGKTVRNDPREVLVPLCNVPSREVTENWGKVDCKKCLTHRVNRK